MDLKNKQKKQTRKRMGPNSKRNHREHNYHCKSQTHSNSNNLRSNRNETINEIIIKKKRNTFYIIRFKYKFIFSIVIKYLLFVISKIKIKCLI
jgi:hypothetical protein